MDEFSAVSSVAHGLLGDVSAGLAQGEGVAGVQHTAVGIATTVDQVVLGLLSSGAEHGGAVEVLGQHGLGDLGTEVAQIDHEGVAASLVDILQGLLHVDLALHDADRTLVDVGSTELLCVSLHEGLATVDSQ